MGTIRSRQRPAECDQQRNEALRRQEVRAQLDRAESLARQRTAARVPSAEETEAEEARQRVAASQARISTVVASEEGEKQCCASDSQAPKPGRQPSATEEELDQGTARGGRG
jgi:hypothetical protein